MEPSVKDKHIIWGFVGFAILLISSIATLVVADKFNQDNFVRLIVFVCSNLLGWLLYFSFQTVIFDTYEIYRIKFGKKKTPVEIAEVREDQPQDAHKPVPPASMPTGGEAAPDIRPTEIAISPELHEKNRADYEDREQRENEERIAMVMEYIHFIMPRIADKETVNHICGEVNNWMRLHSYKPKPIKGRGTHEELMKNCEVYQQIARSQLSASELENSVAVKEKLNKSDEEASYNTEHNISDVNAISDVNTISDGKEEA